MFLIMITYKLQIMILILHYSTEFLVDLVQNKNVCNDELSTTNPDNWDNPNNKVLAQRILEL